MLISYYEYVQPSQVMVKDKTISDYESQMTSARHLHAETKEELSRLEEHHRDLQNDLGTSKARRENLEHNVSIFISLFVHHYWIQNDPREVSMKYIISRY